MIGKLVKAALVALEIFSATARTKAALAEREASLKWARAMREQRAVIYGLEDASRQGLGEGRSEEMLAVNERLIAEKEHYEYLRRGWEAEIKKEGRDG